jgi:transcription initiation factor TFIIE subunit beta
LQRSDQRRSIDEIYSYLSIEPIPTLETLLRQHEKIDYDEDTGTYAFRPIHNIRSSADLLHYLKQHRGGKGLPVKELVEGWPSVLDELDELEQGRLVLVLPGKDGTPRFVFGNDPADDMPVDDEFREQWHGIALPTRSELVHELEKAGLKPASVDPATVKGPRAPAKPKAKAKRPRKMRITNTHLPGILREYST